MQSEKSAQFSAWSCTHIRVIHDRRTRWASLIHGHFFSELGTLHHSVQSIFFGCFNVNADPKLRSVTTRVLHHYARESEWCLNHISWGCIRPFKRNCYAVASKVRFDFLDNLQNTVDNRLKARIHERGIFTVTDFEEFVSVLFRMSKGRLLLYKVKPYNQVKCVLVESNGGSCFR